LSCHEKRRTRNRGCLQTLPEHKQTTLKSKDLRPKRRERETFKKKERAYQTPKVGGLKRVGHKKKKKKKIYGEEGALSHGRGKKKEKRVMERRKRGKGGTKDLLKHSKRQEQKKIRRGGDNPEHVRSG